MYFSFLSFKFGNHVGMYSIDIDYQERLLHFILLENN